LKKKQKNRLIIPGGSASIRSSGYSKAGSIMYNLAITANNNGDFFPIWGTCLGFQLLLYLSASKKSYLASFPAQKNALPLNFSPGINPKKNKY
jgi:gamma-glutamyl hydrolase